jgi:dTMP kinase
VSERGKLITLEGPEGGGKSTQARLLSEWLGGRGVSTRVVREPGGTPTGELIRGILQHDAAGEPLCAESEVLLFAASRAQLVRAVILPALERGTWVLSDRFADSTTAYQGYGRGFDVEEMIRINGFAIGPAIPDRTFLLDVETGVGFERLAQRHVARGEAPDRIECESRSFHERVRAGYREMAARWPDRFRVIDASAPAHRVQERIRADVLDLMERVA